MGMVLFLGFFYEIEMVFIKIDLIGSGLPSFYRVFYWVLPSLTEFLLGFTEFDRVFTGFSEFDRVFTGFLRCTTSHGNAEMVFSLGCHLELVFIVLDRV